MKKGKLAVPSAPSPAIKRPVSKGREALSISKPEFVIHPKT